ncbi:MAG TPA: hypothetical protein VIK04_12110 [Solirubrobacteraceae bacterium]
MAHLIDNSVVRWGFGWEGSIDYRIDDVRAGDAERMAQLMAERGLDRWWELTRRFVTDAPDRAAIARDRQDHVCGFLVCMSPSTAPAFADEDPIVGRGSPTLASTATSATRCCGTTRSTSPAGRQGRPLTAPSAALEGG